MKPSQWFGLISTMILSGCAAYAPPIQEMSDARQSVQAALEVGAEQYFPFSMKRVEEQLAKAEGDLAIADFRSAQYEALAAKNDAVRVRNQTRVLISVMQVVHLAERVTNIAHDTKAILTQAMDAAQQGNESVAMVLAAQARERAEVALQGHELERAKMLVADLKRQPLALQNAALADALLVAEDAIRQQDGKRALHLLSPYVIP